MYTRAAEEKDDYTRDLREWQNSPEILMSEIQMNNSVKIDTFFQLKLEKF